MYSLLALTEEHLSFRNWTSHYLNIQTDQSFGGLSSRSISSLSHVHHPTSYAPVCRKRLTINLCTIMQTTTNRKCPKMSKTHSPKMPKNDQVQKCKTHSPQRASSNACRRQPDFGGPWRMEPGSETAGGLDPVGDGKREEMINDVVFSAVWRGCTTTTSTKSPPLADSSSKSRASNDQDFLVNDMHLREYPEHKLCVLDILATVHHHTVC